MKSLVTGATGTIGSLVTRRLVDRGERPCVLVRDVAKARALFGDRVEIRTCDLSADRTTLSAAFAGVESLFLLNSGPTLAKRDRIAALAARAAGVRQLVKLSTLDARSGVGTGPWHARGEAAVRESGIPFTFVQPAAFMSNALFWAHSILSERVLRTSTGDGKIAFIHPDDIAEISVHAMTTREHLGETLVITGPHALSYAEMANTIGRVIGQRIRFESITDEQARVGVGAYADALVDIWRAIRQGRVSTVTHEVERILGRAPRSFEQWVVENVHAFVSSDETRGTRATSAWPPASRSRVR